MVVHSCVNGKMNGETIKQHIGKEQLTLYVLPSSDACLLLCYMNQMVFFCCTSIIPDETALFMVNFSPTKGFLCIMAFVDEFDEL